MKKLADDCFIHDRDRMRHDDAVALLSERLSPIVGQADVDIGSAQLRIAAEPVLAPRAIPAFDNAAVDGFAFAFDDFEPTGGYFPISGRIAAGEGEIEPIPDFSAARIFTGAEMPAGADTVVMQEDCETDEQDGKPFVRIPAGLKRGANCRRAGEDVEQGAVLIEPGTLLRPQEVAAIASTGKNMVRVFNPLRIGLISSGDEILRPGDPFRPGGVYDANHHMLDGLLNAPSFAVSDLGISPDNFDQVCTLLSETSKTFDVIISTGGASRGEEDHFVKAIEKLGYCHLWQLAVKPGRPMSFGQIGSTPCFTLPGNPVAVFVCFLLYVRPALMRMAGAHWPNPQRFQVPADFEIRSKPDRREFLRGYLETDDQGRTILKKFERDGSGLISGLRQATGLIEIAEDTTSVSRRQMLNFLPFSGLMQ